MCKHNTSILYILKSKSRMTWSSIHNQIKIKNPTHTPYSLHTFYLSVAYCILCKHNIRIKAVADILNSLRKMYKNIGVFF